MNSNPFQEILNNAHLLKCLRDAQVALKPNPISIFDNLKDNTSAVISLALNLYIGKVQINKEIKDPPRTLFFVDQTKPDRIYEQWPAKVLSPFFENAGFAETTGDLNFWCLRSLDTKTLCHLKNEINWLPLVPSGTLICFKSLQHASEYASKLTRPY